MAISGHDSEVEDTQNIGGEIDPSSYTRLREGNVISGALARYCVGSMYLVTPTQCACASVASSIFRETQHVSEGRWVSVGVT